jgi:hypothetical protein
MRTLKIYTALLLLLLSFGSNVIAQCTNASITTNPSPVIVCAGAASASFTVVAAGTTPVYQWQMNTGSGYVNVVNSATYNGATTPTVTIVNPTVGMNGTDFRCMVTAACGPAVFTASASLGVQNPPAISSMPTAQTVCAGGNASFTVFTVGTGLTYQWQSSTGAGYTNVVNGGVYSGATTNILTITGATLGMNGTDYRCIITGLCGTIGTGAVSIAVLNSPTITSNPSNVFICPNTNTTFGVIAVGPGLSYQWQVNTGSGFANIFNGGVYSSATTNTLTIAAAPASMNGYLYRCLVTGTCTPAATSGSATLNIHATPAVTVNPVNATICENENTSFGVTATGAGLNYQWQLNTGSGFNNLSNGGVYSGATTSILNIAGGTIGMNGYLYRCVVSGTCPSPVTSGSASLTVNIATPTITSQPSSVSLCAPAASASFTVAASGISPAYQWQINTGAGYVNVVNNPTYSGATTPTLTIANPTTAMNGHNFRCVVSAFCGSATTTNVSISVINPTTITSMPTAQAICPGGNATFTVNATGNAVTYQWQSSTGAGFTNVTNGGVYSGATTNILSITGATLGMNATDYRCIVSGTCGGPLTTGVVALAVNVGPSITTSPTNVTICPNNSASFGVIAAGAGLSYQWQVNTGAGFNDIASNVASYTGQLTNTLSVINATTAFSGFSYRCVVNGACPSPVISGSATLNFISTPAITGNPSNVTICENTSTSFSITATGAGLTYQWQAFTGGTWNNLPITGTSVYSGVDGPTLTLTSAPASLNFVQYRCVVNGTCAPQLISSSAFLTVNTAPVIITQPANATACGNVVGAGFSVNATGTGLTYQWQEFAAGGSAWVNLSNAGVYSGTTSSNLSIVGAGVSFNGNQYRCVVSGTCGTPVTSAAASFTVNMIPVMTQQPGNTNVCAGSNTSLMISGTGTGLVYQWQVNSGAGWSDLTNVAPYSGATAPQLNITAAPLGLNNNMYRCILSGTCAPSIASNICTLTVNTLPTINTQPVSSSICSGTTTTFSVGAVAGNIQYQWQINTGSGFTNLGAVSPYNGTNGPVLTVSNTPVSFNGYQYRCVVSGICSPSQTSNSVTLTVDQTPTVTAHPVASTICAGNNTSFSVAGLATGINYQWQVNTGAGFAAAVNGGVYSGATTATLNITGAPASMNGYLYRCVIGGSCAPSAISNSAPLGVNTSPVINVQAVNAIICEGLNTSFNVNATGTALTYQWQVNTGAGFNNVVNGGVYSGATTATLSLTGVPVTMNGYTYQCVISGTCTPAVTSIARSLTVNSNAVITTNPSAATVCINSTTTFTVGATGTGLTYQWQVNNGAGFVNITGSIYAGVNGPVLSVTPTALMFPLPTYRCMVSGTCTAPTPSGSAALFINTQPAIVNQPISATTCAGNSAAFTVVATGTGVSYQWQVKTGTVWNNVINGGVYSGATTNILSLGGVPASMSGYDYRCIVSGTCNPSVTSSTVSLSVNVPAVINNHPTDKTACFGTTTTFNVNASATSYQWQQNTGSGWVNLTNTGNFNNVTTATLRIDNTPYSFSGYQYRCVVSTVCSPTLITNAATLTVFAFPVIANQPERDTVCVNTGASFHVDASGYLLTYLWEVNNGSGWVPATGASYFGANSATLTTVNTTMAMNGYDFRCKLSSGCGTVLYTQVVSLSVQNKPSITFQPMNISSPYGHTPLPVKIYVVANGQGPLSYQWQIDTLIGGVKYFVNMVNAGVVSGVTTDTLRINGTDARLNDRQVQCIVTGLCNPTTTSNTAKIHWYFETGVAGVANNNTTITLYPNPVNGSELYLQLGDNSNQDIFVKVVNNIGSTLINQQITLNNSNTGTVNVGNLAAGVYQLQVTDKDHNLMKTVRFVKQ